MNAFFKVGNEQGITYSVPKYNAQLLKDMIDSNVPFLNGEVKPVFNVNTKTMVSSVQLLPLQALAEKYGFESNLVGTFKSIEKAGTSVIKDSKGLFYNFKDKENNMHSSQLFFPEQVENPEKLKELGKSIKPRNSLEGKTLKVENSKDYLAVYIAACKTGANIDCSKNILKEFKEEFKNVVEHQINSPKDNSIPKLHDFIFQAELNSNTIIKANLPENKQTQNKTQKKEKDLDISF